MTATNDHLAHVRLEALQGYLTRSGWSLIDRDDRTTLWSPPQQIPSDDASRVRLVLPVAEAVTDYDERIEEALRAVAFVERRVEREVLDDVVYGGADTVSVRLTPDSPSGEAPLAVAHATIGALRNFVVGAASSLDTRGLVLPPRRPLRAEAYAREARLSTASGSFVVNLALPLGDSEASRTDDHEQRKLLDVSALPYGRRVTNRMANVALRSTTLARSVGEGIERIDAFARPGDSTANATELAALAGIGEGGDERARYSLRFAHSPLAPAEVKQSGLITVTPAEQRVMEEAADFLRTKQPRSGVTVSGLVVRLTREGNLGPGDIVVQGIDDDSGAQRRFRMNLVEKDYSRAIHAHEYGLTVLAMGDVELRGNQRRLSQLRSFDVIETLYDES